MTIVEKFHWWSSMILISVSTGVYISDIPTHFCEASLLSFHGLEAHDAHNVCSKLKDSIYVWDGDVDLSKSHFARCTATYHDGRVTKIKLVKAVMFVIRWTQQRGGWLPNAWFELSSISWLKFITRMQPQPQVFTVHNVFCNIIKICSKNVSNGYVFDSFIFL